MAIKNNNMRKIPNYDHEPVEHVLKLVNSAVKCKWFSLICDCVFK